MTHLDPNRKLESFLRSHPPDAPINAGHKATLRRALVDQLQVNGNTIHWFRYVVGLTSLCTIAGLGIYLTHQAPIVALAERLHESPMQQTIRGNHWYSTGEEPLLVTLQDYSQLHVDKSTIFRIQSKRTDRNECDSVIELRKGIVDANVTKKREYHLYIQTPDVDIQVIGTRFTVHVE